MADATVGIKAWYDPESVRYRAEERKRKRAARKELTGVGAIVAKIRSSNRSQKAR
jgi:hypothetical protein